MISGTMMAASINTTATPTNAPPYGGSDEEGGGDVVSGGDIVSGGMMRGVLQELTTYWLLERA